MEEIQISGIIFALWLIGYCANILLTEDLSGRRKMKLKIYLLAWKQLDEIYRQASFSINGKPYHCKIYERDLDKTMWLLNKGWPGRALACLKKNNSLIKEDKAFCK